MARFLFPSDVTPPGHGEQEIISKNSLKKCARAGPGKAAPLPGKTQLQTTVKDRQNSNTGIKSIRIKRRIHVKLGGSLK
jgi:hypothetical protein